MRLCPYENNPCKVTNCKCVKDEYLDPCGLYTLLNVAQDELKASTKTVDRQLINSLKEDYVNAWNKHANSRAKGKATGSAFENWIVRQLGKIEYEKGKANFSFGRFGVDVAMPSLEEAEVILETKIYTDIQHTLAVKGLLDFSPEDRKVGFVILYEPESSEIKNILSSIKASYSDRFEYFVIERGWTDTIRRLKVFVGKA